MISDEEAKATQEVAKATQEGIGVVRAAGSFFGRFIEGPLEQASGMLEDKLKFMRFERLVRLQSRTIELMEANGMEAPTRDVPPSFLVGVLEAGSLEADDELQDIWARLLVNAADAESDFEPRHAFISMLKDMSSLDAKVLNVLVNSPARGILPEVGHYETVTKSDEYVELQMADGTRSQADGLGLVQIPLWNLLRLGCIEGPFWGDGTKNLSLVRPTLLAEAFVKACTLRTDSTG